MAPHTTDPPKTTPGTPAPLGPTCLKGGVNFSIHCPAAQGLDLLLFDHADSPRPSQTINLDTRFHRTATYWHIFIANCGHGQVYAWQARGSRSTNLSHKFDGDKVLLDPYGRAVTGHKVYQRQAARAIGDNGSCALRSVVVDNTLYDWQDDHPLPAPKDREIIYEMHASGFTKSPSSGLSEKLRGTYAGFIQKIPYLRELGITAVELLPVHQFDDQDAPEGLTNFWGYSTVSFFAPHAGFSSDQSPCGPVDEFRDLVKALHLAGIRIILDVVYNHTTEAGKTGPTLSWRGLDNPGYYLLNENQDDYADFTGCGNTINANGAVALRMIMDSLRYWVQEMHVDGFRFDLASAMTRGRDGSPLAVPPIIQAINCDPVLASTTLIAEAWDAVGLYQVGSFPGDRFAEWNGPFRDHARAFWRGDLNTIENIMGRIVGSPDLMNASNEIPSHSINFVTCHDGFCLNDLVSYEKKHNLNNREENRDGSNHNTSCNHGMEGPTTDPNIEDLRLRQIRNFLCLLFLSHGTPMILMGDEIRHSRQGNNNPWCQDNELNWFDWNLVNQNNGLLNFTRNLIELARNLGSLGEDRFWSATCPEAKGDITWHGHLPGKPDWSSESHCIAYSLRPGHDGKEVMVIYNAGNDEQEFTLPNETGSDNWHCLIDTSRSCFMDEKSLNRNESLAEKTTILKPKTSKVFLKLGP